MRRFLFLLVIATLLAVPMAAVRGQEGGSVPAVELSPQVAVDWIDLWYNRVMAERINPPAGARLYGYAGLTLYQAVLPGMPTNFSYANQLNGLTDFPFIDPSSVYDWITTANAASKVVMIGLFPKSDETQAAAEKLYNRYLERRKQDGIAEDVLERSIRFGQMTAQHILDWASTDQYTETRDLVYEMPVGEMAWEPTTPGFAAVEPFWGQLRPFALSWNAECALRPRIEFSPDKNSAFYQQAMEVKLVGDKLTQAQKDTAQYWLDNLIETGTPAGHWMLIGSGLVSQLKLTLARSVEMYSLLGITVADAFIGCWSVKYTYNLLRPETYIKRYIQPQWQPYIQTPAFPEYPSGHSVVSGAAAETLTFMFGHLAFTDHSKTRFNMPPRKYLSFYQAADEAAWSRLYGGIHYRLGIEMGLRHGECIGRAITQRINMKPTPQGE